VIRSAPITIGIESIAKRVFESIQAPS
jgi:hypothetical protein